MRHASPFILCFALLLACRDRVYYQQPPNAPPAGVEMTSYTTEPAAIRVEVAPPAALGPTSVMCTFGVAVPGHYRWSLLTGYQWIPPHCDQGHAGYVFHAGYRDGSGYWHDDWWEPPARRNNITVNHNYNYGNQGPRDTGRSFPETSGTSTYKAPSVGADPPRGTTQAVYRPASMGTTAVKADAPTTFLKAKGDEQVRVLPNKDYTQKPVYGGIAPASAGRAAPQPAQTSYKPAAIAPASTGRAPSPTPPAAQPTRSFGIAPASAGRSTSSFSGGGTSTSRSIAPASSGRR